jgi:uncharacterized protein (DUF1697 family)
MTEYVALLRGINVGGKNPIRMTELKACFEKQRLHDVATFIQSGNVLFSSDEPARDRLTQRIERALSKAFGYDAAIVLRSQKQLKAVVERAPPEFGAHPNDYRYDTMFLKEPMTASTAMKSVLLKDGVDRAWAGPGVLYFSRLVAKASQSRLSRLASLPIYRSMTIRNWNTTTKLLAMMSAREAR